MHARGIVALLLLVVSGPLPGFSDGLLRSPGQWVPFMERLERNEFLAVEHALGGTLSDTAPELLIYSATKKEIRTAITLVRQKNGGFRLKARIDQGTGTPSDKIVPFPADIATRLLAAMELCLAKQLYPPTGQAFRYPDEEWRYGGYWVNLRINQTESIAGLAATERCMTGQDSSRAFLEVMYQLEHLIDAGRVETEMLTELDIAIASLRASFPGKG